MLQYVVGDAILLHFCDALQGGQYHRSHQQDDFKDVPFCQILSSLPLCVPKREYIIESGGDAAGRGRALMALAPRMELLGQPKK